MINCRASPRNTGSFRPNRIAPTILAAPPIATVHGDQKMTHVVGGWPSYHTHWTPIEMPEAPVVSQFEIFVS